MTTGDYSYAAFFDWMEVFVAYFAGNIGVCTCCNSLLKIFASSAGNNGDSRYFLFAERQNTCIRDCKLCSKLLGCCGARQLSDYAKRHAAPCAELFDLC